MREICVNGIQIEYRELWLCHLCLDGLELLPGAYGEYVCSLKPIVQLFEARVASRLRVGI
jgi:hypothetical protein